jgi:hypothetical protein
MTREGDCLRVLNDCANVKEPRNRLIPRELFKQKVTLLTAECGKSSNNNIPRNLC